MLKVSILRDHLAGPHFVLCIKAYAWPMPLNISE